MLETKRNDDQSDAPYYSIGLTMTISFPGADSLVELERHFY